MFERLLELEANGVLKNLVLGGFMSPKVYFYMEIHMWILARQKSTGLNKSTIVTDAEIVFGVSRPTIWTALKAMK